MHTPGPWIVQKEIDGIAHGRLTRIFGLTEQVATTYNQTRPSRQPPLDRAEANARLIAEAPNMLEALKMIATHHDGQCDNGYSPEYIARAAINKAIGQPE